MSSTFTDLLVLADTPSKETGFGIVTQNILPFFRPRFRRIDIFGINYFGELHELPYRITSAAVSGQAWNSAANLKRFLSLLEHGNYSHVFIMQDTFLLSNGWFPKALQEVCARRQVQCLLYYPVDSPLDPAWLDIVLRVQTPVAYTQYGVNQTLDALRRSGLQEEACQRVVQRIKILPHGVDRQVFRPLDKLEELRAKHIKGMPADGFLMINVNANQRRKDPARCLEILAELKRRQVPARLMMQMARSSADGMDLEVIGAQLGLVFGRDWFHGGEHFNLNNRLLPKSELNIFYNVAKLMLTTTKGEGWGLSITEALAAGTPVALPDHTACAEIAARLAAMGAEGEPASSPTLLLPLEPHASFDPMDNSRARYRVDVTGAADIIEAAWKEGLLEQRRPLNKPARKWLSWMRIANEWLELMEDGCRIKLVSQAEEVESSKAEVSGETGVAKHYYMEIWGGLGDAFNRLFHEGAWQRLMALDADEQVTVALMAHNPHVRELFTEHPNFAQIRLLEFGYWQPGEFQARKKAHGLPLAGTQPMPKGKGQVFFPVCDAQLGRFIGLFEKLFGSGQSLDAEDLANAMAWTVLIAPAAGLADKDIPREWTVKVCEGLRAAGFKLIQVGRNYKRFNRKEPALGDLVDACLVDELSVMATANLLQQCAGVVTPHSALNILAWHLRKPQLLIYQPQAERHLKAKDRYGFGVDYPESICVASSELPNAEEYVAQFVKAMRGEKVEQKKAEVVA